MAIFILLLIYFLPTIFALARGKKNAGSTIVINLFFGWTILGWVIALSMAFGEVGQNPTPSVNHTEYMPVSRTLDIPKSITEVPTTELDVLKKEKLSAILDDWADGRITEEQYKIKKEKIMLL